MARVKKVGMKQVALLLLGLGLILSAQSTKAQSKRKRKKANIKLVISTAEGYKGTPYQYGGNSRNGIDCSALMQNSFSKAGYQIPRTSKEQSKYGKKVGWNRVRPGDIVFFKFKEKRKKWYHSGLITSVDGDNIYFIHASTSRGVIQSNLSNDYYKSNVKTFRRVIK
ncbi:C40 family peptidase [Reichenbachiella ulvae]|uniref:NlpC/P60 family protein n=1 Tax=Reichenbachiella ulvae TaxID=2980104 RepID=A0ABT3CNE7_9BACT|nr:NlpC/P60 family protein [Reichenbachiella ulvae]MCV9385167.1 NlpC/P60 family protein [Reichenbachiella ulvae]